MKSTTVLAVITTFAVTLTACATPFATTKPIATVVGVSTDVISEDAAAELARSDTQGAVGFVVTPLNLAAPGATLDFDVSMNTHSIDLGWDLAARSRLVTDTGLEVSGQSWPVGSGHHYEGTLSFPATTAEGQSLLDGAARLTLSISGTDVAERLFTWELKP
jgi:hypothetical protein